MSMRRSISIYAALLSGCHTGVPAETADHLIGEEYPDAGKYRAGAFTYSADEVNAVEVYWRSGEVWISASRTAPLFASRRAANCQRRVPCTIFWMGTY